MIFASLQQYNLFWWTIFVILLVLAFAALLLWAFTWWYYDNFVNDLHQTFLDYCATVKHITYRGRVAPTGPGYSYELAVALLDISFNTTTANCPQIEKLPSPVDFPGQLALIPSTTNGSKNILGFIFYNQDEAIISFAGTNCVAQWHSDFDYVTVPPTTFNGYTEGVLVHQGFYQQYLSVRPQILGWLQQHRPRVLYLTGHSLGGALSTFCAYDLAKYPGRLFHYSFGAPRSGNTTYAEVFNQRVPQSIRVNNTEDIIVALPPATWDKYNYCHTGGNLPFTVSLKNLRQDHVEAYYDNLPIRAPCIENAERVCG